MKIFRLISIKSNGFLSKTAKNYAAQSKVYFALWTTYTLYFDCNQTNKVKSHDPVANILTFCKKILFLLNCLIIGTKKVLRSYSLHSPKPPFFTVLSYWKRFVYNWRAVAGANSIHILRNTGLHKGQTYNVTVYCIFLDIIR